MLFTIVALLVNAQNKKIDLASDPNKPILSHRSNAQLMQEAKDEPQKNDDSGMMKSTVIIPSTTTPNSSSQIDQNGQRLNTQSSQINIGNKKATSTIQYDNSGKIRGNGTSIQFGK